MGGRVVSKLFRNVDTVTPHNILCSNSVCQTHEHCTTSVQVRVAVARLQCVCLCARRSDGMALVVPAVRSPVLRASEKLEPRRVAGESSALKRRLLGESSGTRATRVYEYTSISIHTVIKL